MKPNASLILSLTLTALTAGFVTQPLQAQSNDLPEEQPPAWRISSQNWREAPIFVKEMGDTHRIGRILDLEAGMACYLLMRKDNVMDTACTPFPVGFRPNSKALEWRKTPNRVRDINENTTFLRFLDTEVGVFCHMTAYTLRYSTTPDDTITCNALTADQIKAL
jgi:hypothetical protein